MWIGKLEILLRSMYKNSIKNTQQRLFVAIGISDGLKRSIENWQARNKDLIVRFISPKNLHLTLIPPWYADSKKIIRQLRKFLPLTKPFEVSFNLIEPRARVIWTKGPYSKKLSRLQKDLAQFLRIKTEKRTLLPHITLTRFKKLQEETFREEVRWSLGVESFALMKSNLSPKGASYKLLAEFPLKK